MELLGLEIGAWADFGVALATLILAFITILTVREMHLQQKKDRLQKEMTLLVGPLRSHQDSDFFFGLTLEHRPSRYRREDVFSWRTYYQFWDDIMVNMYLGDPDLLWALQNYFAAKEDYLKMVENFWPPSYDNTPDGRHGKQRVKTTREALRIETNRRYDNLKRISNIVALASLKRTTLIFSI